MIKALSVRQPWASLIASGRKTIELRTWSTKYRGPILILAGGAPWKGEHGHELGPLGVVVATVEIVDCREFSPGDLGATCVPEKTLRALSFQPKPLGPKQWFSWVLRDARPVTNAPAKGKLGLYAPDAELLKAAGIR